MFVCRRCASRLVEYTWSDAPSTRSSGVRQLSSRTVPTAVRPPRTQNSSPWKPYRSRQDAPFEIGQRLRRASRAYSAARNTRPFRLAIIGSGPAGFYSAARVLKHNPSAKIDMYERLPVPYGLVRYGVAPDHPEVKNVQDRFDEVAESPNFEFVGNVDVGAQIPLDVLGRHYDAILFTYGASEDRLLGIPGENLKGVWSARSFVAWYNGLPGFSDQDFNLRNAENAVVIGQGNVSLDVARILLTSVDDLRKTDIPEHVLQTLSESRVKDVRVVGRRGPLQAAFTIKEIRELTAIRDVNFEPTDTNLFPKNLKELPRARKRIAELLLKQKATEPRPKNFGLDFMLAPLEFTADGSNSNKLGSTVFQRQRFKDNELRFDAGASVMGIDRETVMDTSLAFRSIGYKSTPLHGLDKLGIQFNMQRGIISNEGGRVVSYPTSQPGIETVPQVLPGLYVAGWVKRGPTGVIASTMEDAFATGDAIAGDFEAGLVKIGEGEGWNGVQKEVQGVRRTDWKDWKRIDQVEKERGAKLGKEREKIIGVEEMLGVLV